MSLLRQWWFYPADYDWTVAYHRANPLLRRARMALGVWCGLYTVVCVLATHTTVGMPDGVSRWFVLVTAATAAVAGILWVRGPWPSENTSRVFVAFLELSAAGILLVLADPFVALSCAAALGISGSYIACFHSPKMFLAHQGWAVVVVGVLFVRAIVQAGADVVLACIYLVLLTLVLFSSPILTQLLLLLLQRDAATALFDPLTGLRNRRGLDSAITDCGDRDGTVTVMVIDLDRFKALNDRYGHAHGDMVLRSVANAIYAAFVPPSITARIGGEEFVVITHAETARAVEQARALQRSFTTPAGVGVTASIGIAQGRASTLNGMFDDICRRADTVMYEAKRAGGNTIRLDTPTESDIA